MGSLASFANWLWLALTSFGIILHNFIVRIFNEMIEAVAEAADYALTIFPTYTIPTPGQLIDSVGFLSALNWVLPISFFVDCLTMMVFGYFALNVVGPIFRWTKLFR